MWGKVGQMCDSNKLEMCNAAHSALSLSQTQFLNSVRLWDFIEEREHRGTPQYEDEVNELGELFMQLSGAGDQSGTSASH